VHGMFVAGLDTDTAASRAFSTCRWVGPTTAEQGA
jgi:hypothetical protein